MARKITTTLSEKQGLAPENGWPESPYRTRTICHNLLPCNKISEAESEFHPSHFTSPKRLLAKRAS